MRYRIIFYKREREQPMKVKKDPKMRREAFIKAATELFVEKGYDAVSIRAVLDAVGDKTASPTQIGRASCRERV